MKKRRVLTYTSWSESSWCKVRPKTAWNDKRSSCKPLDLVHHHIPTKSHFILMLTDYQSVSRNWGTISTCKRAVSRGGHSHYGLYWYSVYANMVFKQFTCRLGLLGFSIRWHGISYMGNWSVEWRINFTLWLTASLVYMGTLYVQIWFSSSLG